MKSIFFTLATFLGIAALGATPQPDKSEADIVRSVLPSVVNLTVHLGEFGGVPVARMGGAHAGFGGFAG